MLLFTSAKEEYLQLFHWSWELNKNGEFFSLFLLKKGWAEVAVAKDGACRLNGGTELTLHLMEGARANAMTTVFLFNNKAGLASPVAPQLGWSAGGNQGLGD